MVFFVRERQHLYVLLVFDLFKILIDFVLVKNDVLSCRILKIRYLKGVWKCESGCF